jgi:hypothetical protein
VQKAATRLERERAEQKKKLEKAGTLLPTSETVPGLGPQPDIEMDALLPEPLERPARTAETSEPGAEPEASEPGAQPGESEPGTEPEASEPEHNEARDEVKSEQT